VVLVDERNYSPTDLLAAADMTMYDAKDAGRDQWAILDHELFDQPRTGARLAWSARIEEAVRNDDLTLHLQPILDLASGRVIGAEALLRLSDGADQRCEPRDSTTRGFPEPSDTDEEQPGAHRVDPGPPITATARNGATARTVGRAGSASRSRCRFPSLVRALRWPPVVVGRTCPKCRFLSRS